MNIEKSYSILQPCDIVFHIGITSSNTRVTGLYCHNVDYNANDVIIKSSSLEGRNVEVTTSREMQLIMI